jgi:LSD1 subclass zinc finger protein
MDKHYIAVDKDEVMRCSWCGTTESKRWIRAENRGVYCSSTCDHADDVIGKYCFGIVISIVLCTIFLSPVFSPDFGSIVAVGGTGYILFLSFIAVFLGVLPIGYSLWKISVISRSRTEVPRQLRDVDILFDERYLQCEKCGGPLEIVDGATAITCSFCGYVNRTSYDE